MGKFCTACGKGIDDNQDVCIHCVTSLNVNVEQEDIDEHVSHESDSSYSNQVVASETGVNDDDNQTSVNEVEFNDDENQVVEDEVEFNDDENQVVEDETEVNNGGKQVIESENNQDEILQEQVDYKPTENVTQKQGKSLSIMKKIFIGLAGGLLILLIGLFVWAKNYQSYTSVEKRFENALASADVDELSKLMIRQDEQSLNIYETEAFLDLYYEVIAINELKTVYDIVEHGKFLGVFKAHKVQVIDQYVLYNNYFEELSFVFNDIIPEAEIEDNTVVYGPMTPGIYTVKATFDSQYGLMNVEDSIMLMNPFEEPIRLGMDIPIGQVSFYIENYEQIDIEKTQIFVHDYMIPLSDYKVENIGPLIIDGSQTVQIVTDMPWGEVLSEEVAINDTHLYLNADTITEEQFDTVLHHLVEFGEQYVEALANQQIDVITTASRDVKKMIDDDINRNRYFSGKFKRVELDNVYTTVLNEGENLSVLAKYVFESDFHTLEESPELREDSIFWRMELGYDQSLGQWLIEDLSRSSTWSFTMTHEKEGSGELKGPSEDVINQAKKEQLYLEMNDFIEDYIKAEVKAINGRDMKYITDYVTENDTYKKELSDYIEYVDAEELVEEVYMTKVDNIEEKSKDEWHVTIIKEYELNWPDTYEVKKDQTVLKVIETNEQFFVDDIITSDEL